MVQEQTTRGRDSGWRGEAVNERESRFMRIKRYSLDQLSALHASEKSAGKDWYFTGIRFMDALDAKMGPYFDEKKPEVEKSREIERFLTDPELKRAFARLNASQLDEVDAVHEADLYVHRYAYTPHLGKGKSDNLDKLAVLGYAKEEPRQIPYDGSED